MAEQDTSPDEEMTPEGMAELADQTLREFWQLKYGEGRPIFEEAMELKDMLKEVLKGGQDRTLVVCMGFSALLTVAWRDGFEASESVSYTLMDLAKKLVNAAEAELEAEEP